jgi:glycerol-3-phosphate dehydrogenase
MTEDQAAEFAWFESLQNKLIKVFLKEDYSQQQAEELGFFVAQGIRDVPPLLRLLDEIEQHSTDEIMDAIYDVLSNRSALKEASDILLGQRISPHSE